MPTAVHSAIRIAPVHEFPRPRAARRRDPVRNGMQRSGVKGVVFVARSRCSLRGRGAHPRGAFAGLRFETGKGD